MLHKMNSMVALSAILLICCLAVFSAAAQDRNTARISGRVVDNNREPVSKVRISWRGKTVGESAADGSFAVNVSKAESRVALTFTADGYVSNTRVFDAKGAGNGTTVIIWAIAYRVTFDPSREFDVQLGSSRIRIPANVLIRPAGQRLGESVVLLFTPFDITDPFQRAATAGDFSGQLRDGSIRRLNSFGIFDLDVRTVEGQQLTLSRGARIDLSIGIPRKLATNAPREIGYFDFDTTSGRWIQVGDFAFVPRTLTYNGSVTSFGGVHNLDYPQDTTCVTVQVTSLDNGSAMPNFSVTAHGPQYDSFGTTDSSGFVCLLVQRNASFTVEAHGNIGASYFGTPGIFPTFTSPNFSSGAADCGKSCTSCPFLGTVGVSLIVGTRR